MRRQPFLSDVHWARLKPLLIPSHATVGVVPFPRDSFLHLDDVRRQRASVGAARRVREWVLDKLSPHCRQGLGNRFPRVPESA